MFKLFTKPTKTHSSDRLLIAGMTHIGNVRKQNEDAIGIDDVRGVAVIADGVGGLGGGDIASQIIVASVLAAISEQRTVGDGVQAAHKKIVDLSRDRPSGHMASTVVALTLAEGKAVVEWIGDSRAYLWRDGQLNQLTKDHTFVQQLLDFGAIAPAEAEQHPNRNVVTRTVGQAGADVIDIDRVELRLKAKDRLLLCSDGLSGYLSSEQISAELQRGGDNQEIVLRLIDCTLKYSEAGDNITVVCASIAK